MDNSALNLVKWAETELKRSGIGCARQDAEVLFMSAFGARREDLYLMQNFNSSGESLDIFKHYIKLRISRYPLQYILKKTDFMSLTFMLEDYVFIPRPETELLVEIVIGHVKQKGQKRVNIFDIGTGSGNIAISLTKNLTGCKIVASDISEKALLVAVKNARSHGAGENIKFIRSDLFGKISPIYYDYFDIIVSNPPYVRKKDVGHLQPEIFHEDIRALDGGDTGLYFYKRILREGFKYLKKGGTFAFEIGYDQAKDITSLTKKDDRLSSPKFFKDYNGHNRIALIQSLLPNGNRLDQSLATNSYKNG